MPDAGAGPNLYWADRGQVVWADSTGLYVTNIATGAALQLVDNSTPGFGGLVGLDAANVYGEGGICPQSACTFTVNGVPRAGGTPFVAFQSTQAYWTNGLTADDSGLYWIDWKTPGIYHAALTKGAQTELVVKLPVMVGGTIPSQIGLDACNVYWLSRDSSGNPHVMAASK